eukprot:508592_1
MYGKFRIKIWDTIPSCKHIEIGFNETGIFHLHPQRIANNFLRKRNKFKQKLFQIINTNLKSSNTDYYTSNIKSQIEQHKTQFILSHFGIGNFSFDNDKITPNDENKINTDSQEEFSNKPLQFNIPDKLESTKTGNIKSKCSESKTDNCITNECKFKFGKKKEEYKLLLKSHKPGTPVTLSYTVMSLLVNYLLLINCHNFQTKTAQKRVMYSMFIRLGNNILRNATAIYYLIKNKSICKLITDVKCWQMSGNLSTVYGTKKLSNNLRIVYRKLYEWKKQGINSIQCDGYMFIRKGFEMIRKYYFNKCVKRLYKENCLCIPNVNIFSDIPIECMANNYNHNITKVYLVAAACMTNNIIKRVSYLCLLSLNCYSNKEYMMGWRLIHISFYLSNGYFINDKLKIVYKQKDIMRKKISEMKCSFCKQKPPNKCKVCIGCMKKMYCNKKCQKKHWNKRHRLKCNKTWCNLYFALKTTFFDRL